MLIMGERKEHIAKINVHDILINWSLVALSYHSAYSLHIELVVIVDFFSCGQPFVLLKKLNKYYIFYYDLIYH
jgi:hypothetical protein